MVVNVYVQIGNILRRQGVLLVGSVVVNEAVSVVAIQPVDGAEPEVAAPVLLHFEDVAVDEAFFKPQYFDLII